jgi:hypothetical protein
MITVNWAHEHYDCAGDFYAEVDLACEVEIEGTDTSVGIMSPSAEVQSCVDSSGADWFDRLSNSDVEAIGIRALEQASEYKKNPPHFRSSGWY